MSDRDNPQRPAIELWVPGPWRDLADVQKAGVSHRDAGVSHRDVSVLPRNDELTDWLDIGSGHAFDAHSLAAIAAHESVACVKLRDTGDKLTRDLLETGQKLQQSGGLGVRLARCGLAHPWDRWKAFLCADDPGGLYRALVLQVVDTERGRLETFGMNQFGLPDASVEIDDPDDKGAAWSAFAFNAYVREERPKLKDGHTFQAAETAPVYVLTMEADDRYAVSDPFFNPAGLWCLSPPDAH